MEIVEMLFNYGSILTAVASIAGAVVMLFLSARFVSRTNFDEFITESSDRHNATEKRLHETDLAIKVISAQLARMPRAEDIQGLIAKIGETNARLAHLEGQNDSVVRNTDLLLQVHTKGSSHA